ncbi:23S rRNA pseudouridine(2605) synthase RluB [sulfur-oxidizing endosymbiont of Gigantopelta aegis]|uniref:23S rRNA pseudouridine(2605) synthase RluB n=1 Tax=sulfur-oxidizing endosymbiont of Gigantopelta aegis TaxID=2794934 RepID=UPI0018DE23AE|nr:pseudouridine synthase [sulfur-oxidizing endosymbiont of Gigantopelta aegis]
MTNYYRSSSSNQTNKKKSGQHSSPKKHSAPQQTVQDPNRIFQKKEELPSKEEFIEQEEREEAEREVPQWQPEGEKLQKVIARSGHASRRETERLIAQGRFKIDKEVAKLGDRVVGSERIFLDDKELFIAWEKPRQRVLAYHKPPGEICSRNDPEHSKTIFDDLPSLKVGRWISVGRLDINTSGLILLTNDGELANLLMHPSSEIVREYAVRVLGEVTDDDVSQLKEGITLDDGLANFEKVSYQGGQGANHWYHVTLKEGRNREVRRMWEAIGATVSRLQRVRYGVISLPRGQKPGRWEDLDEKQMLDLYESVGLHINKPEMDHRGRVVNPLKTQRGKNKKRLVMPDNRRKSKKKKKVQSRKR